MFEDDDDRAFFLRKIKEIKRPCGVTLFAYCLMGNHVHLLLRQGDMPLGTFFKRLGAAYVYRFNHKYGRSGPLFRDRYKSAPVEDGAHFLDVVRYIFQSPVRANLCRRPGEYRWSSYASLDGRDSVVDGAALFALVPAAGLRALADQPSALEPFASQARGRKPRHSDEEAIVLMAAAGGAASAGGFQALASERQRQVVSVLHGQGVSIRQLSRLSGLSKGIIERWLKD
jgi:REP element-mobilizing transposase RayT